MRPLDFQHFQSHAKHCISQISQRQTTERDSPKPNLISGTDMEKMGLSLIRKDKKVAQSSFHNFSKTSLDDQLKQIKFC